MPLPSTQRPMPMAVDKKSAQAKRGGPGKGPVDYKSLRILQSEQVQKYEESIRELNEAIDKVKLAYHLYFIGTHKKFPREERAKLDRLALQSQQNMPTRTMERFRMQTALIRYTHFCEMWDKSIRKLEAGETVPWVAISRKAELEDEENTARAAAAAAASPAASNGRGESSPALTRLTHPMEEQDEVRKIYTSYVAARKKVGDRGEVSFEKFQAAITKQTETLLSKVQASAVQYRVEIVDNKVAIKAKPIKDDDPSSE